RRDDRPALVLVLLGEGAAVAGVVGELAGLEALHVVDVHQQQQEHPQAGEGDPAQGMVHTPLTTCVIPSSWIGCGAGRRAVSLIRISTAMIIQLATRDEPPWDRKGVVIPVSGMSWVTPPTITKTCRAITNERPVASSLANGSRTATAARRPRSTMRPQISNRAIRPVRPSSSPKAVMMKSLCTSGVRYGCPCPSPVPSIPPKPSPYIPCASW